MTEIMTASHQWATRPDDQRFTSLESLRAHVALRRELSKEPVMPVQRFADTIKVDDEEEEIWAQGQHGRALFSHHSFGQLCSAVGAPAQYLRKLPPTMAAINLQYCAEHLAPREDSKFLVIPSNGKYDGRVRGITSPSYGRIWGEDMVDAIIDTNVDGRWQVPCVATRGRAASDEEVTKRDTTLYASDRDEFVFLVDPTHPVEIAGELLFRGFIAWNSEVGDKKFGLTMFLYRQICANRIIWGASQIQSLFIRHTSGGPQRFAEQAVPTLRAYSEGSTKALEDGIVAAKATHVAKTAEETTAWLVSKGFGREVAKVSVNLAEREEGDPTSLWNVVQGVTAYARSVNHTDDRVDLERKAGDLLTAF